jgi:hypothetical protein
MAATDLGRRLTGQHRAAQGRLGAAALLQARRMWRLLNLAGIAETAQPWVDANLLLIERQHRASVALSRAYLTSFRLAEAGAQPAAGTIPAATFNRAAAATSLYATGPGSYLSQLKAGRSDTDAARRALNAVAGAAARHVLAGGRDTLTQAVAADSRALGWARATSGGPCAFCAMLASRGPDFGSEASAGFQAHDSCACQPEPVYRSDAAWPSGAQQFRQVWDESTRDAGDLDPAVAFRRAYEGRT